MDLKLYLYQYNKNIQYQSVTGSGQADRCNYPKRLHFFISSHVLFLKTGKCGGNLLNAGGEAALERNSSALVLLDPIMVPLRWGLPGIHHWELPSHQPALRHGTR